jgi:hypothetical protein
VKVGAGVPPIAIDVGHPETKSHARYHVARCSPALLLPGDQGQGECVASLKRTPVGDANEASVAVQRTLGRFHLATPLGLIDSNIKR